VGGSGKVEREGQRVIKKELKGQDGGGEVRSQVKLDQGY